MTPQGLELFNTLTASHAHTHTQTSTTTANTATDTHDCLVWVHVHVYLSTHKLRNYKSLVNNSMPTQQVGRSHLGTFPRRFLWPLWPAPQKTQFCSVLFLWCQKITHTKHQLCGPGQIQSLSVNISKPFLEVWKQRTKHYLQHHTTARPSLLCALSSGHDTAKHYFDPVMTSVHLSLPKEFNKEKIIDSGKWLLLADMQSQGLLLIPRPDLTKVG